MIPTGLTFMPASSFSERVAALCEAQREKVARESPHYPPGLLEQYQIQLEILESRKIPSGEIMLVPWAPRETGKLPLDKLT